MDMDMSPTALQAADLKLLKDNPDLRAKMVAYIRQELSEEVAGEIRGAIADDPEEWRCGYHFGWGMWLRNLLRGGGFGEAETGLVNLDNVYIGLVEDAVALGG